MERLKEGLEVQVSWFLNRKRAGRAIGYFISHRQTHKPAFIVENEPGV
jgi:hypothetical protein